MSHDLTYISFGAGRQSTALAVCSVLGLHGVPKADVAIFADTQGEIAATYEHVERMKTWLGERGLPLHVVSAGSLEADVLDGNGRSHASIPAFVKTADGTRGVQRRFCTYDYKLVPIQRKARELCGLAPGDRAKGRLRVRALLGISWDEAIRMKDSREEWIENAYPLVDARLTVFDCERIVMEAGLEVPPRSSCYFCPYHSQRYWRWLREKHAADFARAVLFDSRLRHSQPGLLGEAYLHSSLLPLKEAVVAPEIVQGSLFGEECEGVCGV